VRQMTGHPRGPPAAACAFVEELRTPSHHAGCCRLSRRRRLSILISISRSRSRPALLLRSCALLLILPFAAISLDLARSRISRRASSASQISLRRRGSALHPVSHLTLYRTRARTLWPARGRTWLGTHGPAAHGSSPLPHMAWRRQALAAVCPDGVVSSPLRCDGHLSPPSLSAAPSPSEQTPLSLGAVVLAVYHVTIGSTMPAAIPAAMPAAMPAASGCRWPISTTTHLYHAPLPPPAPRPTTPQRPPDPPARLAAVAAAVAA